MIELTTANSFIVRVYRVDSEDPVKLTGQVEMLDGSGKRMPFTDIVELCALLNSSIARRKTKRITRNLILK